MVNILPLATCTLTAIHEKSDSMFGRKVSLPRRPSFAQSASVSRQLAGAVLCRQCFRAAGWGSVVHGFKEAFW